MGIRPKLEAALNSAGITSYEILANISVKAIQDILQAAEGNFSLAEPYSWSEQAILAQRGEWDGLQALQAKLHGGKDSKKMSL